MGPARTLPALGMCAPPDMGVPSQARALGLLKGQIVGRPQQGQQLQLENTPNQARASGLLEGEVVGGGASEGSSSGWLEEVQIRRGRRQACWKARL